MSSRLASTTSRIARTSIGQGLAALALGVFVTSLAVPASAAERTVKVAADQAKVVRIDGQPATIILGNPTFADVSVQAGHLIVYGRSYGTTNLIVLNKNGTELENLVLQVYEAGNGKVSLYKAGQRSTLACAPSCEATLDIGDNAETMNAVNTGITTKMGLATTTAKMAK